MATWTISYWINQHGGQSVESWLDKLPKVHLKLVAKELALLARCGNKLSLPHSRAFKRGLFELRERMYGYRLYYGFLPERRIVLLHAGNKATQAKDISLARLRLAQLMEEEAVYENERA